MGSVETGKLADLVLWKPAFFGIKPSMIIKGGMIVAAPMGDPNASIPTPQPVHYRPMFGAFGGALHRTSVSFVSKAFIDAGSASAFGLQKQPVAVSNCRRVTKADMIHNTYQPHMEVDPETYEVRADGELQDFVDSRYGSWDSGIGAEIESGNQCFESLADYMLEKGEVEANQSGRQEMLENLINRYM